MSVVEQIENALLIADYLEGELHSSVRHEYVNGQVYAMGGASDKHGLIVTNLASELNTRLPDECQVFVADMKVHIKTDSNEIFYYPDVLVSCDEKDREPYYRESPCLIIEVLSPSTDRYDRFEKFNFYIQLPSLMEYVLVSQEYRKLEVYRRLNQWQADVYTDGEVQLNSVGLKIPMDIVYRRLFSRKT